MKINEFIIFLKDFYLNRNLILQLSKNDLKSRYSGSMFGITWAFVQPLVSILVFWFVFQVGFRNPPVGDIEFILWFVPAFVSWNYFSDALLTSSNSLQEYSYLVKKIKFRTSILPMIKVFSSTIIHLFFIIFLYLIFWVYGRKPILIYLQLFYYMFSLMILLIGLSWIVSSLSVFFKDFSQIEDTIFQMTLFDPIGAKNHSFPTFSKLSQEGLKVTLSGVNWIDITNEGVNKGIAVNALQKELTISPEQTMVFGDYMNDLEMLRRATYSYAMKNAEPEVKEVASYVTEEDNDNNGVLKTIIEKLKISLVS